MDMFILNAELIYEICWDPHLMFDHKRLSHLIIPYTYSFKNIFLIEILTSKELKMQCPYFEFLEKF